jgi:phosphate transport system permease protein
MSHTASPAIAAPPRRRSAGSSRGDTVFAGLATAAGLLVLVLLGAIIVSLFIGGLPSFRAFGLGFLTNTDWDPVRRIFGAGVPVYGTAMMIARIDVISVP